MWPARLGLQGPATEDDAPESPHVRDVPCRRIGHQWPLLRPRYIHPSKPRRLSAGQTIEVLAIQLRPGETDLTVKLPADSGHSRRRACFEDSLDHFGKFARQCCDRVSIHLKDVMIVEYFIDGSVHLGKNPMNANRFRKMVADLSRQVGIHTCRVTTRERLGLAFNVARPGAEGPLDESLSQGSPSLPGNLVKQDHGRRLVF